MAHTEGDGVPHAEQTSTNGHGGPDSATPPRTVAEEAALLVDLLSRRGGWATGTGEGASGPTDSTGSTGTTRSTRSTGSTDRMPGDTGRSSSDDAHAPRDDTGTHECTCGGQTPQACRVCPVCQLISFVQKVSPETIERVADFALFAATALRDLAVAQRERREPGDGSGAPSPADGADGPANRADGPADGAGARDGSGEEGAVPSDRPGRGQGETT